MNRRQRSAAGATLVLMPVLEFRVNTRTSQLRKDVRELTCAFFYWGLHQQEGGRPLNVSTRTIGARGESKAVLKVLTMRENTFCLFLSVFNNCTR